MKTKALKKNQIKVSKGTHTSYEHKLARTPNEHKRNLDLLFALQRLAYPELKPGLRMNKKIVRLIRPGKK